jgi:hypothetical protein
VIQAVLDGELVTVYTRDGKYLSALSLQELESRLSGDRFARVHRRALVNLEHVLRLEPTEVGGYTARTTGGHAVEVSHQAARDPRKAGLRRSVWGGKDSPHGPPSVEPVRRSRWSPNRSLRSRALRLWIPWRSQIGQVAGQHQQRQHGPDSLCKGCRPATTGQRRPTRSVVAQAAEGRGMAPTPAGPTNAAAPARCWAWARRQARSRRPGGSRRSRRKSR